MGLIKDIHIDCMPFIRKGACWLEISGREVPHGDSKRSAATQSAPPGLNAPPPFQSIRARGPEYPRHWVFTKPGGASFHSLPSPAWSGNREVRSVRRDVDAILASAKPGSNETAAMKPTRESANSQAVDCRFGRHEGPCMTLRGNKSQHTCTVPDHRESSL